MTIDEHRAAGTCSVCGGRMDTFRGGANRITADEYRHGGCVEGDDLSYSHVPWEKGPTYRLVKDPPAIGFRLVHPAARQPCAAHDDDSGDDLFACSPTAITPGRGGTVEIGIAVKAPPGFAFYIAPRSGLSAKDIRVMPDEFRVWGTWDDKDTEKGEIDHGYRGTVKVRLFNLGLTTHHVEVGDRVAQLCLKPVYERRWQEEADLGETSRQAGGFGSTGA